MDRFAPDAGETTGFLVQDDAKKFRSHALTGQRFGRLVVITPLPSESGRTFWQCRCDCGVVIKVRTDRLMSESKLQQKRSCGCLRKAGWESTKNQYLGHRSGCLVVSGVAKRPRIGQFRLQCKCDCGKSRAMEIEQFVSGAITHCGCLSESENSKQHRLLCQLVRDARNGAFVRGLDWNISDREAIEVMARPCSYCGVRYSKTKTGKRFSVFCNGIDRINSDLGYSIGNIAACCSRCNIAKARMTRDEFLTWAFRVAQFNGMEVPA